MTVLANLYNICFSFLLRQVIQTELYSKQGSPTKNITDYLKKRSKHLTYSIAERYSILRSGSKFFLWKLSEKTETTSCSPLYPWLSYCVTSTGFLHKNVNFLSQCSGWRRTTPRESGEMVLSVTNVYTMVISIRLMAAHPQWHSGRRIQMLFLNVVSCESSWRSILFMRFRLIKFTMQPRFVCNIAHSQHWYQGNLFLLLLMGKSR